MEFSTSGTLPVTDQEPQSPRMAEGRESSSHWGAVHSELGGALQSQLLTPTPWNQAGLSSQPEDTKLPEGHLYSLNSARLKRAHLKLVAEALGLPTGAGVEETRQLIEGHIISTNREPGLVQVIVREMRRVRLSQRIYLVDQTGVFAEADREDGQDTQSADITSELEELCAQLERANCELDRLQRQLQETVKAHEGELKKERDRVKQLWKQMCDRVGKLDSALAQKDALIEGLNQQLAATATRADRAASLERARERAAEERATTSLQLPLPTEEDPREPVYPHSESSLSPSHSVHLQDAQLHPLCIQFSPHHAGRRREDRQTPPTHHRRGKAPPVQQFTGDNSDELLDDWLPTLERAGAWNAWSQEELLMQMAGHLRGRALQEWNLLTQEERSSWGTAVEALKSRLEPRDRALAAQDFRHATQRKSETVADYVRRMERAFQLAYGRDGMLRETRQMILFTQLQEGLLYRLVESPAVSGAKSYTELCLAAKNEERRQAELEKRREYSRDSQSAPQSPAQNHNKPTPGQRRCYNCGEPGHLASNCPNPPSSDGKGSHRNRGVHSSDTTPPNTSDPVTDPLSLLFSDESDEEKCRQVTVEDKGSRSICAPLQVEGVPAYGLVDTGADITIIGPRLFKKVAAVSRLKKKDFKPADKTPHGYDGRSFELHGRMQLTLSFDGQEMKTMVYIKMDVEDQLLLSEGVCRQLGIVKYHPNVEVWRGCKKRKKPKKLKEPKVPRVSCTVKLVKPCPPDLPAGSYWYGTKRAGTGRPPKWTEHVSSQNVLEPQTSSRHQTTHHYDLRPRK